MFYTRNILPKLEKELNTKEIIVLTGMRQVGKTTILKYLFKKITSKNKIFFDLENPLHRKIFEEENYDNIWNNLEQFNITNTKKTYIFLDEIQNLPQISQTIKYLNDHWQTKFIVTGSSSFYLKNLFPESLAGRKLIFELFPLTFREFLVFKNIKKKHLPSFKLKAKSKNKIAHQKYFKYYQEFIQFGGFPKVILEKNTKRKKLLLEEIFKSYFEQDVKKLADFKQLSKLRDLILLLIPRVGSKIDITKLGSALSLSRETIYNYLSFLQQTYFISLISKFSNSIDRQTAGSKKLYLCDTGLANLLGQISIGQALENSVFQNLRPKYNLNYYSKGSKNEIDFIINKKIALEIKTTATPKDFSHLTKRSQSINLKQNYITTLNFSPHPLAILTTDL